jgi:predicted nuclease of predicted toxin-antitoxin system
MRFLVDAQLPPALAHWLPQQGHVAHHIEEVDLRHAEDVDIWNRALVDGAIIITKDEDFAERAARDANGPVIVWLRVGNSTNRALFEWLNPRWADVTELLNLGSTLIEVR